MSDPVVRAIAKLDAAGAQRLFDRLPETLRAQAAFGLARVGESFVSDMKRSFYPRRNPAEMHLQVRSGFLRRSINWSVLNKFNLAGMELRVFTSGVPYAVIQEYGGTITPKNGKYLTIPLPDALTPSGVPKYPSAAALRGYGSDSKYRKAGKRRRRMRAPSSQDELYIVMRPNGRTFVLNARKGFGAGVPFNTRTLRGRLQKARSQLRALKREKLLFLYKLERKVTIPPRFGFRRTWDEGAEKRTTIIRDSVDRAIKEALRA